MSLQPKMATNKSRNDSVADKSLNRSHATLQRVRSGKGSRKFSHKYDMIKNNTHLHGWIAHVEDPFNFYVRFNDWNTQQFTYLMTELQEEAPSFAMVNNPQQGNPYVALSCGKWYRVLLESVLSETKVMAFFVDIGDRQTLNLSNLREIEERFLCLPVQASLCQLGCITVSKHSPKQTSWPSESSDFIKNLMIPDSYVNIFVVGCYVGEVGRLHKKESKLYVTVYMGEDEQSVNSKLSEAGHGHSVQEHEEPWHKAMRVAPRPPDKIFEKAPIANSGQKNSKTLTTSKQVERRNSMPASTGHGISRNIPPITIEVSMSHAMDPGKFFIRHNPKEYQSQQQILDDLGPRLQKARNIQFGELYAVLDVQSMNWYRGHCLRQDTVANEVVYEFYLIDEGRSLQVSSSYINHLNDELKSSRPMVWECSLYMKKPKGGWAQSVVDLFKKLVHRERLKMTIFSAQEGIRRVDLAQIPLYNSEPVIDSIKDALASAIQAEKLANGHPQPPAVPPKPVARKYFSNLTGVKKGATLHGQIVSVYNPDSFYVRFDESDAQRFSMFDSQLQAEYNAPSASSVYEVGVPQKGFPYVLRHDDRWHRILVEDSEDEQYSVFFVDAGLRLTAKASDMLQILDRFIAYPVQVTLCKLYGVCTKVPSGIWSVESKFCFKQMVSDARVTAYVEGFAAGGIGKTCEEETLFSVVLYKGDDCVSLNTRFTRAGYAISVRQHDLPAHNRPKEETDTSQAYSSDSLCSSNQTLTSSRLCDNPSPRSSQGGTDRSGIQFRLITPQECVYEMTADDVSPVGPPPKTAQNQGKPRKISLGADSCLSDMSCTSGSNFTGGSPNLNRPFCSSAVSYGDLSSNIDTDASKTDDADAHLTKSASPTPSLDEVAALESVKIIGSMPQEGDYVVSVKFLMCESPEAIYVRPLPYEARFEQLAADMQHAYRAIRVRQIRNVCPGAYCAAFVYGQWIRAVVVNCLNNLHCLITSMDTGQPHQVTVEQIFPLIKPFCFETIPKLALKCSLAGLAAANGAWDPDLVPKITFALLGADEVFISCQRPKNIPDTMVVRIVYGKAHANGKTLVNLNEQLLQAEFGHSALTPFNNNNTNCSNLSSRCCPER